VSPLRTQQRTLISRLRQVLTWTFTGSCVVAGGWAAADAIAHAETFQVQEVRFVGSEKAPAGQLRHLADVPTGTHLFHADLSAAITGVETHPWVDEASARRRFPGAVEIHVREHEPKMLLALDALWLISSTGEVFKRADSGALDYPILTGITPALTEEHPQVARAVIDDALNIHTAVDGDEQIALAEVSEIHFDANAGFSIVMRSGTRILLGFADPFPALDRLTRMRERGLDLNTPQHIDLDVGKVAIVTPLHSPPQ